MLGISQDNSGALMDTTVSCMNCPERMENWSGLVPICENMSWYQPPVTVLLNHGVYK